MNKGIIAVALSVALLSGCVISIDDDYERDNKQTDWTEVEKNNREKISQLGAGDAISTVRRQLGVPDFDELIMKNDNEHRVLFYRTQRVKSDGVTSKQECTPILFINGELSAFGESALNALQTR